MMSRRYRLLGQAVAQLDIETFRVVVSNVAWRLDERCVSSGAVMRHAVVVVLSV